MTRDARTGPSGCSGGTLPNLSLPWRFPAADPHDGIPLGNGLLGALVWGAGNQIRITINRADFWDRRGYFAWGPKTNYANLKQLLEAGDEEGLRRAFERPAPAPGTPDRTTRLPMGRIDLTLPDGVLTSGVLDLYRAEASVHYKREGEDTPNRVHVVALQDRPVLVVQIPDVGGVAVDPVPAWEGRPDRWGTAPAEFFQSTGYANPRLFMRGETIGWILARPGEPSVAVLCRKHRRPGIGTACLITAVYIQEDEEAIARVNRELDDVRHLLPELLAGTEMWWRRYWEDGALLCLPDPDLQRLYYMGIYKMCCMTMEGSPGATLQGAWVEEYRLPPWQGDYHFNINVQECYWPAFGGNQPELLHSLFDQINAWKPKMREYARIFAGIDDGYMLPHAVNDRCDNIGGFWSGSIDHGSTAWVGQLMWHYWRYTGDLTFLRETAYPFLRGAMRVYEEMLEQEEGRYVLPVSVSPEYNGDRMNARGRNASYQLAAIHFLCRALLEASRLLDLEESRRPAWEAIASHLPLYSLTPDGREIALWDGQALAESHRHHSHLAGVYPFGVLSFRDPRTRDILSRSYQTWVRTGMGQWTGWCFPWAAILHARCGNGGAAEALLQLFARAFVTQGYGTLHDARFQGLTVFSGRPDVMQVEAAMGFSAAIQEMLLHTDGGKTWLFPAVPPHWRDLEFSQMRAEGAFIVSGRWRDGKFAQATVESRRGGRLCLSLPETSGRTRLKRAGTERFLDCPGRELILDTRPGDVIVLMAEEL